MESELAGAVVVITGVMAAGKSTVAQLLAERLPRSAHVRGDQFRRAIVCGRVDPTPENSPAETEQLWLRYRLAARVADEYAAAGFSAVVQDVILGTDVPRFVDLVRTRPRFLVTLAPRSEVVAARERDRPKSGYGDWSVEGLERYLWEAPPDLGLWLDTSAQTPAETVEAILAGLDRARILD